MKSSPVNQQKSASSLVYMRCSVRVWVCVRAPSDADEWCPKMVGFCRQKSSAEKVTFSVFTRDRPLNWLALLAATVRGYWSCATAPVCTLVFIISIFLITCNLVVDPNPKLFLFLHVSPIRSTLSNTALPQQNIRNRWFIADLKWQQTRRDFSDHICLWKNILPIQYCKYYIFCNFN